MDIAFRVDASNQIGTGHCMRCLALADVLTQRGARVRFVSRYLPVHLRERISAKGLEFRLLDGGPDHVVRAAPPHAHWLGVAQVKDAQDTVDALADRSWDWLVVDNYALDAEWESALRKVVGKVLVIDDLADRRHDCDVLLDQNLYAEMDSRYSGKVPANCRLLLGPHFALLRDEFRLVRENVKPRTGPVKRLLVFFGGVDAENLTTPAIEALASIQGREWQVDVVIGAQHAHRDKILATCSGQGYLCHVQTGRMAELMAAADLAVGAGGVSIWERCCLGLPALSICAADNQDRQIVDAAAEALLYSPQLEGDITTAISRHVTALIENPLLRNAISRCGMKAVDGHGVIRVAGVMGCCGTVMRIARQEDSANLFKWRNHPSVRMASRDPGEISWTGHQNWFTSVLNDSDRTLLIGERGGVPVGVVRFDVRDDQAAVSIYLVPDAGNSGLGRDLLQSAEAWFARNRPGLRTMRADVLGLNRRSHGLFVIAGYEAGLTSYIKRLQ